MEVCGSVVLCCRQDSAQSCWEYALGPTAHSESTWWSVQLCFTALSPAQPETLQSITYVFPHLGQQSPHCYWLHSVFLWTLKAPLHFENMGGKWSKKCGKIFQSSGWRSLCGTCPPAGLGFHFGLEEKAAKQETQKHLHVCWHVKMSQGFHTILFFSRDGLDWLM